MSQKRLHRIAEGKEKVAHGSTFRIDVKAIRERQGEMAKEVADALFGKKKAPENGRDTRRIAKARAWKQFSMFIRLRDAGPDGYGQCVTCQRRAHWRTMDACHWITRAKEATLFDERNVHLGCKGCNRFQGGKPLEHEQAIIRKYGPDAPEQIKAKAVQMCKRTIADYVFIENTYRERVALIRRTEPARYESPKKAA